MSKLFAPEQLRLSNGIPVVLQHYDGPVASTYWWVRVGSADEVGPEAGFAHFLEHMLFKDAAAKETGRASTGQMARAIESLGGDINAYTSFDQTVYHVTCAAHHWEKVLDVFGTMAKPQKFLKKDFDNEREVILEELRKNEDSPGRQLFQSLFSLTFKKHPYGRPVIGYAKTLKAAKVGALESFYRRNYISGRMGLVLVGPIHDRKGARRKAIIQYLEKHYGGRVHAKREAVLRPRVLENPVRSDVTLAAKEFDVKSPTLSMSFRVPELRDSDIPALDVLSGVLGMGELSRVYQRLFYQTSLAVEASGGLYVPSDPGMLYFQAEVDSLTKVNPAAEELIKELERMRREGPTQEELQRVVVSAESERLYATQTADGMAGRLGFLRFIVGDLDFDQKYLEELRGVDALQVQEVARRYLDFTRMNGVVLVPKGNAGFDVSEIGAMAKQSLAPEEHVVKALNKKKPVPASAEKLPVDFFKLPSGVRVAFFERPQSHVFSLHAAALGGLRLELARPVESAEKDWGASYLTSLTWTKGTSAKDARTIAKLVEGNAASMDGFSGRNTIGLQMTGLSRDWAKLSDIFTEVLMDPTFPEEEIGHSRRIAEDTIRGIEDHTSQVCTKLFLETLFENHPYGKLTIGSLESIASIDQAKLKAFHRMWIRPERLVISVSGNIKRPILELWLGALDQQMRKLSAALGGEDLPITLKEEPTLKAPRWVEKSLGREQTHILVGGLGTHIYSDDRHALRLLQNLLGGQSGRLFIELREKKSLAYSVSPVSFEGIERGYIGTYIACAPNKKEEAAAGIRQVLEQLAEKGPKAAEVSRAKEFYLGRRAMDLQSDSSLAAHYGLEEVYGLPRLTEEQLIKKVQAITPRQIQEACRRYLVEPFMVHAIVG